MEESATRDPGSSPGRTTTGLAHRGRTTEEQVLAGLSFLTRRRERAADTAKRTEEGGASEEKIKCAKSAQKIGGSIWKA